MDDHVLLTKLEVRCDLLSSGIVRSVDW